MDNALANPHHADTVDLMSSLPGANPHVVVEEAQAQLAAANVHLEDARFYLGLARGNTWESPAGRLYQEWLEENIGLIELLRNDIANLRHASFNI